MRLNNGMKMGFQIRVQEWENGFKNGIREFEIGVVKWGFVSKL